VVDRYPEYNARHHDAASHLAAEVGIGILTVEWYPPLESDDEAHVCTLLHSLMLEVHVPAVLLPSQVHWTIAKVGNRTSTIAPDAQGMSSTFATLALWGQAWAEGKGACNVPPPRGQWTVST